MLITHNCNMNTNNVYVHIYTHYTCVHKYTIHTYNTHTVLVRVSIALLKLLNLKELGEDVFRLTGPHHSPSLREVRIETRGRNLDEGTQEEVMEECYLLACFPWPAQFASEYMVELMPRGIIHSGLCQPTMKKTPP